jgi:hypothetical protein
VTQQGYRPPPIRPGHYKNLRARPGRTILYMLLMGVLCWWIAIQSYFFLVRIGLSPAAATKLPIYAFVVGLAMGVLIGLVKSVKDFASAVGLTLVTAAVFWFFGLVIEGFLVAFGVPPAVASWVSRIGFVVGALIGSVTLFVLVGEWLHPKKETES